VNTALDRLKKELQAEQRLNPEAWEAFAAIWEHHSAERKVTLTQPGQKERYLYFILAGVQRVFHASEADREATLVLTYPYSFGGVLDAFLLQGNSRYYYETLTASEFLRVPYAPFQAVLAAHPPLDALIRQRVHQAFSGLLYRMVELQSFTSEQKFRALLHRSPHILQQVPHKYLANYLGISIV